MDMKVTKIVDLYLVAVRKHRFASVEKVGWLYGKLSSHLSLIILGYSLGSVEEEKLGPFCQEKLCVGQIVVLIAVLGFLKTILPI